MPRIRNISHNGFSWLYSREKLIFWHKFISIFEPHFKDVKEIEPIYFNTLLDCAKKWDKQSPKRLITEAVIKLLKFEGRLQNINRCAICNQKIEDNPSLINNFMPAHSSCANLEPINKKALEYLFKNNSTIWLDDDIVDRLYLIALKSF